MPIDVNEALPDWAGTYKDPLQGTRSEGSAPAYQHITGPTGSQSAGAGANIGAGPMPPTGAGATAMPPGAGPGAGANIGAGPEAPVGAGTNANQYGMGGLFENPALDPGGVYMGQQGLSQYPTGGAQNFPYPPEWDVASGTYGRYSTGQPVTGQGFYGAHKALAQQNIEQAAKQAAEQAGLRGTRWSTPLQRNIADISGQQMTQLGANYANMQQQAREQGASRAMQAAGGLGQLGQQYFQAPMDWSRQMYGMGTGQQGLMQQGLGRQYQDFLRMTPEASPWLQQAMGYGSLQSQMVPQQYQPSGFSQWAEPVGSLAGSIIGGIIASSRKFKKNIEDVSETTEEELYSAMINTPLKQYQYKTELDGQEKHLGVITEESPEEITMINKNAVGIVEYIGALHATIKTLAKKVGKLEKS